MPLSIQLVQFNNYSQQRPYLPYSVGLLQAYCQHYAPERYHFRPILYERLALEHNLAQAHGCDVLALSLYTWNARYSLHLAQELKKLQPQTLVVAGGPHVPDQAEAWLREHPYVDVAAHGEGETLFLELLEALPGRDWQDIQGISYLQHEQFIYQAPRPRRRDLEALPSPFLAGVFDTLMQERPQIEWMMTWESNRGCPFRCSYCDWGSATAAKVNRFPMDRLKAELEWISQHNIYMVYCADANFGMLKRDLEITEYLVDCHRETGFPRVFLLQSAKNVTERSYQIHRLLAQSQLISTATLSLQSLNPVALRNTQRENISLDVYRELQRRFRRDGVRTYTDILIGLPGETVESFIDGLGQVIEEGQHEDIRFYPVYLLPNAEMAQPEFRQRFQLETVWTDYIETELAVGVDQKPVERQELLVAHSQMTRQDWCQMRIVAWWVRLILTRKLLHLPLVLLRQVAGISHGDFLRWFLVGEWPKTEILGTLRHYFRDLAQQIVAGGPELVPLSAPLSGQQKWVSVEVFVMTGLIQSQSWAAFYNDAQKVLEALLQAYGAQLPAAVLQESLRLNAYMAHPRTDSPEQLFEVSSNFWQVYHGALSQDTKDIALSPWRGRLQLGGREGLFESRIRVLEP